MSSSFENDHPAPESAQLQPAPAPHAELRVPLIILPHGRGIPLPSYETAGAAGMDIAAAVDEVVDLRPHGRALIPTGLAVAIPAGYEGQIRPRSGLAIKQGLSILNAPGTIDSDYRGEIKIIVINLGEVAVSIYRGMRIAQLVIQPVVRATWDQVADLPATSRGEGGFGSTGVS